MTFLLSVLVMFVRRWCSNTAEEDPDPNVPVAACEGMGSRLQNIPVLNWGCRLTQAVRYNGRKTVNGCSRPMLLFVVLVMLTSTVVDGRCYAYAVWKSKLIRAIYFFLFFSAKRPAKKNIS